MKKRPAAARGMVRSIPGPGMSVFPSKSLEELRADLARITEKVETMRQQLAAHLEALDNVHRNGRTMHPRSIDEEPLSRRIH
jgi:hypothetical protein